MFSKTKKKEPINVIILLFLILLLLFCFAGTAAAETFEVSDDSEFYGAINTINNNGESDNTIVLLNDIEITDSTFTQEDYDEARTKIVAIDYTGSGNLVIKSDSAASRRVYTNFSNESCYPFFNITGNDTLVTFENIVFDGFGIFSGGKLGTAVDPHRNITIKGAKVIHCTHSGIQLYNLYDSILENVTVSNCSNFQGGGFYIQYCENLTLLDCLITNNTAFPPLDSGWYYDTITGGGVYLSVSSVDIRGNTEISGNTVDGSNEDRPKGGGIDSNESYLRLFDNVNISNNSVTGPGLAIGGGVYMNFTYQAEREPGFEITDNVIISDNKAFQGGGIFTNRNLQSNDGNDDNEKKYVFNISGNVQILNNIAEKTDESTLENNTSRGGGLFTFAPVNISGDVIIQGNKVIDRSTDPDLPVGGGILSQGAVNLSGNVRITDNEGGYGGGICSFAPVTIKDKVLIADNKGYMGGGLYFMNTTTIQDNVTISQNDADLAGGGLYLSRSNAVISGNVEISNNTAGSAADYYGYGGGGIYISNSNVSVSENISIRDNQAQNGGGILASNSSVNLSNNTAIERNSALQMNTSDPSYGSGGGIYMVSGSKVNISGSSDQTVSFIRNTANYGGAVFIADVRAGQPTSSPANYSLFKKTTDESNLNFFGNAAYMGYLWNLSDSGLTSTMEYIKNNLPELKNTTVTEPFSNAYNNFDIVFIEGAEIQSAEVTIRYFNDSVDNANLLDSEIFISYVGAELTEDKIIEELGSDWLNFYCPPDYEAGVLQETLPVTVSENTILNVLYIKGSIPVTVTVNYFTDSLASSPIGTETFSTFEDAEITETELVSKLGDNWMNLHQPTGYKDGELQETLPFPAGSDTVLNILYLKEPGSGPGGGGTGNATVKDPIPETPDNPAPPESENAPPEDTGKPPVPEEPHITVILLFMIAVACYLYVEKRDWEYAEIW